jgi:ferric-dicitrate binding protein FerR (iron transport regulator)
MRILLRAAALPLLLAVAAAAAPKKAAPKPAAGAASLLYIEGKVTVTLGGHRKEGREGDVLGDGDAVATARKASAVILMPDGSRLKLRELSNITLDIPGAGGGELGGTLTLGGVFAKVTKRLAGAAGFHVRAADAVASVRGTQFFTAFGRQGKKGKDLWVCVNEGAVDVSAKGADKAQRVAQGEGVLVKSGTDVTAPQAYDWTKKLNWNMDPARGSVEDHADLDRAYSDLLDQDYR